jgi:dTDP-4-dehydrorhamnose reductase
MHQPKSLIVGASGQVGTQMLGRLGGGAVATSRAEREGWLKLDLAELDSVEQAAALLDPHARKGELEAIYCVGGMTYVDGCESQPELAWRTNARGPGVLAAYARLRRLPFVFFSTDYVFGGFEQTPGPYAEDAPANPLSVYGKTKLEGEQRVLDAHPEALVLRTTVVYGADPRHKNYLYSLMQNLAAGQTMRTPRDQISTPTYNRDLIRAALGLVAEEATGIWNVAGPELMDRLEFAQRLAAFLDLDASLLQGVTTAGLAQPAPRPLFSGLSIDKLVSEHPGLRPRTLSESLEDCGAELRAFLLSLK